MIPFEVKSWQLQVDEVRPAQIVDIRQPDRFARGHLAGAINLPYEQLQADAAVVLRRDASVLVVDPAGARAAEMATWLRARGFDAGYLAGGMAGWRGELER